MHCTNNSSKVIKHTAGKLNFKQLLLLQQQFILAFTSSSCGSSKNSRIFRTSEANRQSINGSRWCCCCCWWGKWGGGGGGRICKRPNDGIRLKNCAGEIYNLYQSGGIRTNPSRTQQLIAILEIGTRHRWVGQTAGRRRVRGRKIISVIMSQFLAWRYSLGLPSVSVLVWMSVFFTARVKFMSSCVDNFESLKCRPRAFIRFDYQSIDNRALHSMRRGISNNNSSRRRVFYCNRPRNTKHK